MNIFILDKNYNQIGMLSNEGANPQAPYFDDLYTQELDTGADTFYFTTLSTRASRDFIEIGNHIIFQFNNRHRLFAISDLEFEHKEGRNVIGVYAEGVGFQLLETFMGEFEGGDDTDGDGEVDNNSGEFLTYDMFLEKVLKDTDWNYQIMSGDLTNINMGKEVTFQNGKNIYALLQDSMQEFGGIELEFRAEYTGGSLNKTIYAYPHKGRGSFVGQRFEYGHNVAGIKKKQEIIDGLDENIILYEGLETVDGLNVEVTYEVDFALRGYEVEELEIGDTHYVIDNDFEPAQIEARIGKIEISFSDPTRNKCYIANFKKISGSKPDNVDSDNIEDIVDDNLDDKLDELLEEKLGENFGEHTHDRLVYHDEYYNNDKIMKFTATPSTIIEDDGSTSEGNGSFTLDFNNQVYMYLKARDNIDYPNYNWLTFRIYNGVSSGNYYTDVFTNSENLVPYYHDLQYIGTLDRRWRAIYSNYIDAVSIYAANSVDSPRYFGYNYQVRFDRDDMRNVTKVTDKQDLLDFITNKVNVYKYSSKTVDDIGNAPDDFPYQEYYGLLAEDFTTHNSSTDCGGSEVAYNIIKNLITGDTNNDGEINKNDGHNKHTYNLPALVTALIGAFQQHVENGGEDGSNVDLSAYATKKYVEDAIKAIELEAGASIKSITINSSNHLIFTLSNGKTIDAGELPSGSGSGISDTVENLTVTDTLKTTKITEATRNAGVWFYSKLIALYDTIIEGTLRVYGGINVTQGDSSFKKLDCTSLTINGVPFDGGGSGGGSLSYIDAIEVDNAYTDTGKDIDLHVRKPTYFDGPIYMTGKWNTWGGASNHFSSIYGVGQIEVMIVNCDMWRPNGVYKDITFGGNVIIDGTLSYKKAIQSSDESLKENIRYLDSETTPDVGEGEQPDFLKKADLHDFIVNQINLCEFNYIGDTANQIGFIANEYEGTKVGDKIVSPHEFKERDDNGEVTGTTETLVYDVSNLLFATIGALQEEVRIKNKKIASLEARLARIEEMLGINN